MSTLLALSTAYGAAGPAQAATCDAETFASEFTHAADGATVTVCDTLTVHADTPLDIADGTTLTLDLDGHSLTVDASSQDDQAGIHVPDGAGLVIKDGSADQSGQLIATGGHQGAGIGAESTDRGSAGAITIDSGKVTATGGAYAAGIGGTWDIDGGLTTITGGQVTATGGADGAGIGGGEHGDGGTVTVEGGTVEATGARMPPGSAAEAGPDTAAR